MAACTVPKFCFCVDLRMGSFIIGYVTLIWSLIASVIFLVSLIAVLYIHVPIYTIIVALNFSFSVIRVIFTVLLLIGIHQYNRQYVKTYLVYAITITVLTLGLFLTTVITNPWPLDIIINVIDLLITIYSLVVIRSYYYDNSSKAPVYPMIQQQFVVQQPQYVMHQTPQYVINQRPQYVMPQPPQYVVHQQPNVMPRQQHQEQQQPPPMYK